MVKYIAETTSDGKIVIVLEGGYHTNALSYGILATISTLAEIDYVEEDVSPPKQELDGSVKQNVKLLKNNLSRYWHF